jgi:4-amino-4-deoxy-L-arabinose transferase-like glycosyltransferase
MALSVWMMFWNLGASSISVASDEVIYVRIVQTIIHEGRIFPLFHGKLPSFEKPPLALWSNALIPWIFGESNWSFRSLSAGLGLCSRSLCFSQGASSVP